MEKRYQVFISSTFADLKDERSKVIQTIMEMDCIPAGMEIFPAIDDEQFEFIKKVIDDCDYYIVIIGGRYGSLSEDGLSYTEKEFDYAIEKGIKVIALIHGSPEKIPLEKSDLNPDLREKLEEFRSKVSTRRLIKYWEKPEDLPGLVALSLSKTIKTYPAIGWVRSNTIGNSEVLSEINELRKRNEKLQEEINELDSNEDLEVKNDENLAGLEDKFIFKPKSSGSEYEIEMTWGELFYILAPYLMEHPHDVKVKKYMAEELLSKLNKARVYPSMNEENYQTLKIHLSTLNLIKTIYTKTTNGRMGLFWSLTSKGIQVMKELRSVKKKETVE